MKKILLFFGFRYEEDESFGIDWNLKNSFFEKFTQKNYNRLKLRGNKKNSSYEH